MAPSFVYQPIGKLLVKIFKASPNQPLCLELSYKPHQIGQKPVDIEVLNDVISKDLDGIEATLRRYAYDIKALSEAVDARPSEIRTYFKGRLLSERATEIQKEILKLGIVEFRNE